jgi:cytochrome c oxidase subunit 3
VSDTVLDHGYIPEEHAPDPVISHGDPTPPGKIGIWMFLASEIMFFMGILGSYIILRSNQHELFARHAEALSKPLAGLNTLVLIFSSLTMALSVDAAQKGDRKKVFVGLLVTLLCACGFLVIKTIEYRAKYYHHTIVARDTSDGRTYVYDGHEQSHDANSITLQADRKELLPGHPFDIHLVSEMDVKGEPEGTEPHVAEARPERTAGERSWTLQRADIAQDMRYGPAKNLFYGCYFTLTGIHGLHVIGGIVAIFFLFVQSARGKLFPAQTEYVGLYWHFVDLVWIFLFPLLYLI